MRREPGQAKGERDTTSDRSVAPIVGIILLFGMVFVGAALLAATGMLLIDALESDAVERQGVNELNELDQRLLTERLAGDGMGSVTLSDELGEYQVIEDGTVSVTAHDQFGSDRPVVDSLSLHTIELDLQDGRTVAYQAGGVFVSDGDESSVRSTPALQYSTETSDGVETNRFSFSVVDVRGAVSHGEHTIETRDRTTSRDTVEDLRYVTGVTIEVENTTYHRAWNAFLTDEFGEDAVTHHEDNRTVVVDAAIDRDRPFTDYVDIYPTIYGGMHAESSSSVAFQPRSDLTVDGYDSREGPYSAANATADLVTVDTPSELRLQPSARIDGVPLSNADFQAQPNAVVSPFAFYAAEDTSPAGADSALTANLTEPFESIEPVGDEIRNQAIALLADEAAPLERNPSPGLYYSSDDVHLSGDTIDTGTGNEGVHIGVDGDLSLTDGVTVTGDGQVHIYVTGDLELRDVTVPDDRASALWIYGTEDATITISDTVQGVVYAPGSDGLELEDETDLYGSVVGGDPTIGSDVDVHFDTSLRSALPMKDADLDQEWSETVPKDLDVTFVLDATGSMAWNDPDDLIEPATRNAIGMLDDEHHRAGVYDFDTRARTLHEISDDLSAVTDAVEANERGSTDISTGMERALDQHDAFGEPDREKHMLLMTDGENTAWGADARTYDQAYRAAETDVTVWTIAFSEEADSALMTDVAEITGGESKTVTDASEIEGVMEEFLRDAIDEEEAVDFEVNLDLETNPRGNHEAFDVRTLSFEIEAT